MNRALIITVGIFIILFVTGVWLFLFLFGAPESPREIFSDLGIVDTIERPDEVEEELPSDTLNQSDIISLGGAALQQLTTTPVAGFIIASSSTGTFLRFAERGTGYVFQINLDTGLQTQVSRTTIPNTTKAIFSPKGNVVVMISEGEQRLVTIGEIPKNSETDLQRTLLPNDVQNITLVDDANIHYTRTDASQTIAYLHKIETGDQTQDFTVDIPDIAVVWDEGHVYGYTKPTQYLEGFLYEIDGGTLIPITDPVNGLIPNINKNMFVINYTSEGIYESLIYDRAFDVKAKLPLLILPEKCTSGTNQRYVLCGSEFGNQTANYVEDWYKGIYSPDDGLWRVDLSSQTAELLSNPVAETGRSLDIINMAMSLDTNQLFFINKTDGTLWLYTIPKL